MLWLKRLEVEGFGPFADLQVIEFPEAAGVTVVYGENMRGKTSLINAIRYAFLGTAVARGSRPLKLHTINNRDRASHGEYGFSVSLTFSYDDEEYELVRSCVPRVDQPTSDEDYIQEVLLRKGTAPLGPQEIEHALNQIFPKDIARFFLFDGELLQEYEELLINESTGGRQISEAIERILGVPILKQGRTHLRFLASQADKDASHEAKKQQNTQAYGVALEQAIQLKEAHERDLSRLQDQLEELTGERTEVEQYLLTRKRYASILEERDTASRRLETIKSESDALQSELKVTMSDAWRSLLRETVRVEREDARKETETDVDRFLLSLRAKALQKKYCDTCDREIDDESAHRLQQTLGAKDSEASIEDLLSNSVAKLADLSRFVEVDCTGEVRQLTRQLRDLQLEKVSLEDRLRDLESELRDSDPDAIRRHRASLTDLSDRIAVVKTSIEDASLKVAEQDKNVQRLKKLISEAATTTLRASQFKANVLTAASDVFDTAIERYKSQLRSKVETSASELFLSMTTEKEDYNGLTINEGYGLTIRHQDGRAEEARSAGAEHVVALALMGSLQQNAPLKGPIVMDSPFGRLDEMHTGNVVTTLPDMAEQSVLLVYEAEVDKVRMRELLGPKLLREYELVRISSRKTQVQEIR